MEQRRRTASKFFPVYQPALNFDFRNGFLPPEITFSRASTATYYDATGALRLAAANVPLFNYNPTLSQIPRLLIEAQATTNKCTNYNAAPNGALTNVTKSGDAAAVLSEVADTAALVAAKLDLIGNGQVFKLDNSLGGTNAFATIGGTPGNTNVHSCQAYIRGGTGYFGQPSGAGGNTFAASASYVLRKADNWVPAGAGISLVVRADPGQIVYFLLNQLQELAFSSSIVLTAGAPATRAADSAIVSGANFGKWFNPWTGTFACKAVRSNAGGTTGVLLGVSQAGDFNNSMYYSNSAGAGNQLNFAVITGGVSQASINANPAAITSVFKTAVSYGPQQFAVSTDNQAPQLDNSGAIAANMASLSIGHAPWILGAPWMGEFEWIRYWQQDADPKMVQYLTSNIYD